jgi:hypothetical protein
MPLNGLFWNRSFGSGNAGAYAAIKLGDLTLRKNKIDRSGDGGIRKSPAARMKATEKPRQSCQAGLSNRADLVSADPDVHIGAALSERLPFQREKASDPRPMDQPLRARGDAHELQRKPPTSAFGFAEYEAPVLPIHVECHWLITPPVLRRLRVLVVSL